MGFEGADLDGGRSNEGVTAQEAATQTTPASVH